MKKKITMFASSDGRIHCVVGERSDPQPASGQSLTTPAQRAILQAFFADALATWYAAHPLARRLKWFTRIELDNYGDDNIVSVQLRWPRVFLVAACVLLALGFILATVT